MYEWTVVGVIVVLVGLAVTVGGPAIRLSTTMTQTNTMMKQLQKEIKDLSVRNNSAHQRIFDTLDGHGDQLANHETRITVLEHEKERET